MANRQRFFTDVKARQINLSPPYTPTFPNPGGFMMAQWLASTADRGEDGGGIVS
eukprot:CAMPEP_0171306826 /NCGR_PEP_ID=MMETSP0816-20121228/16891_1 /TAXON_ID=420281 /ORGANISM="Proboscia inermis, Strain CCAP1064/1" /LENGTH=53 /DNA_ID=CAMNT_0011788671 /DNA_START=557 /DNA_END=715 /DNA_ORIENTATION=-